jgi:carbonic anhydrase/acetyltransferase-like protein (isoleucine patch superfamily)
MTNSDQIISVPSYGTPSVDDSCYIAPGGRLAGDVTLHANVGIWFNAVLRGDYEPIVIGEGSNIQDNVSGHVDTGYPLTLGKNVSVGHNAVIHGCTVEDDCLIGMHATVMNGAVIGKGSLVAAGALVLEGMSTRLTVAVFLEARREPPRRARRRAQQRSEHQAP